MLKLRDFLHTLETELVDPSAMLIFSVSRVFGNFAPSAPVSLRQPRVRQKYFGNHKKIFIINQIWFYLIFLKIGVRLAAKYVYIEHLVFLYEYIKIPETPDCWTHCPPKMFKRCLTILREKRFKCVLCGCDLFHNYFTSTNEISRLNIHQNINKGFFFFQFCQNINIYCITVWFPKAPKSRLLQSRFCVK